MRLCLLFDERLRAVGARGYPGTAVEPGGGVGFVSGHGDSRAGLQGKGHDARCSTGLKLQFLGKGRHGHPPGRVSAFRSGAGIAGVFYAGIRVGGAGHHFLFLAVPPGVGDHPVGCGKCSGRDSGVADASFRGGVGKGRVAEPCTFLDEALKAAGPLTEKFVQVVAAHLVHHQQDHQLGLRWHPWRCRGRGPGLRACQR